MKSYLKNPKQMSLYYFRIADLKNKNNNHLQYYTFQYDFQKPKKFLSLFWDEQRALKDVFLLWIKSEYTVRQKVFRNLNKTKKGLPEAKVLRIHMVGRVNTSRMTSPCIF